MPDEQKSFWQTVPGIITAIATLVTAVGGFLVVLNQVGVFGTKSDSKKEDPKTGIADERQMEDMSSDEMKTRQAQLEAKIKEMEEQMARQNQGSVREPQQRTADMQNRNMPFQETAQIEGTWYFPNGAYWLISQNGVSLTVQEYSYMLGTQILSAGGEGTIIGGRAFLTFTNLSGGSGKAELTLGGDRQSLSGILKDNYGNVLMNLYLTRSFE